MPEHPPRAHPLFVSLRPTSSKASISSLIRPTMATRHRKRGASGSLPNFDPIPSGSRTSPGTGPPPNGSSSSGYPSSIPAWARPVSAASLKSQKTASSATSRSPSPAGDASANGQDLHRLHEQDPVLALSAGCQPDEVYRVTLPAWRCTLRKWLVRSLEGETPILARMQVRPPLAA